MRLALSICLLVIALGSPAMSNAPPDIPLTETRWVLSTVGGNPAEKGRRDAFLTFKPDGGVAGNTGCNTLGAVYALDGEQLSFSPVMTTRMYCHEVARTEQALLVAMDDTRRFVVEGDTLHLVSSGGTTLATFTAETGTDD